MENYTLIIPFTPSYPELCSCEMIFFYFQEELEYTNKMLEILLASDGQDVVR